MIKQIWTVRSLQKLFNGLAFAFCGFMIFYTALNLFILPDMVPWGWHAEAGNMVWKYQLLLFPVISFVICCLLYRESKRAKPLSDREGEPPQSEEIKRKQQKYRSEMYTGLNFICTLFLFFFQLDYLNQAKQIPGFSRIILVMILLALVGYMIYAVRKIVTVK